MYTLHRTAGFLAWLKGLQDARARARIAVRIARAEEGNFGDHKSLEGALWGCGSTPTRDIASATRDAA